MKQELIDLLSEIDFISGQLANSFTKPLASDEMDLEQWARLQDGLKQINIKSQESFLMTADLRRQNNGG